MFVVKDFSWFFGCLLCKKLPHLADESNKGAVSVIVLIKKLSFVFKFWS
jgi:hypothetical protein